MTLPIDICGQLACGQESLGCWGLEMSVSSMGISDQALPHCLMPRGVPSAPSTELSGVSGLLDTPLPCTLPVACTSHPGMPHSALVTPAHLSRPALPLPAHLSCPCTCVLRSPLPSGRHGHRCLLPVPPRRALAAGSWWIQDPGMEVDTVRTGLGLPPASWPQWHLAGR